MPIGIGMVGWATPTGTTKIVSKRKDPYWTPPASVRKEHAAEGDILPPRVPPGPDNPLGAFAMNLGWPSYLMHGTNKPAGVGMRASHGCIRLYPEDVATIFPMLPVGTKVTVVNQPTAVPRAGRRVVRAVVPAARGAPRGQAAAQGQRFTKNVQDKTRSSARSRTALSVDWTLAEKIVNDRAGIATPVSQPNARLRQRIWPRRGWSRTRFQAAPRWDGTDRPVPIQRECGGAGTTPAGRRR